MRTHEINISEKLLGKKESDSLGLTINRLRNNREHKHTGFVFLDNEDNKPILAHLSNRYRYEKSKLKGLGLLWLDFITERNAAIITTELRLLGLKELDISSIYGITNKGGTTISGGSIVVNPDVEGDSLTCATFVLCVLEQFAFEVIDRDSWQITAEDTQWQKEILEILEPYLQPAFYKIQKDNVGKVVRIRPEQIVGACGIYDYSPVSYGDACQAADLVLEGLDNI